MKHQIWMKTIFSSYLTIAKVVSIMEKKVLAMGTGSYKTTGLVEDTCKIADDMLEIIERKNNLKKLKLATEEVLKSIKKEYAEILVRLFIDKKSLATIAKNYGYSYAVMRRKYKEALLASYFKFFVLGYDVSVLDTVYKKEKWICGIYENLEKRSVNASKKHNQSFDNNFNFQKSNSWSLCCSI